MNLNLSMRQMIQIATLAGLVASGIIAMANASGLLEPYWIATRDFVREENKLSVSKLAKDIGALAAAQIRTQLAIASGERGRLEAEIATKELLLKQNPDMPQAVRGAIEDQLRSLRRDLEANKNLTDDLRREQAGRRP